MAVLVIVSLVHNWPLRWWTMSLLARLQARMLARSQARVHQCAQARTCALLLCPPNGPTARLYAYIAAQPPLD